MISPPNFIPSETKQPQLEAGRPRGATRFAAGLFCFGLEREMIYLGGKFVWGLLHISVPCFIGSILPSLSRRKQKCLLTERRSTQVPWLPENPPFAPAVPGTERERRVAPSTRLDKSYHEETVQGGTNSALAEFRAVLLVISRKELVPHRRSREGQGQSAPEPRRPWDIELNPLSPRAWAISFLHPHFFGGPRSSSG